MDVFGRPRTGANTVRTTETNGDWPGWIHGELPTSPADHTAFMASFQQRKAIGDAHERHVTEQLIGRGWEGDFWGQGLLSRALQSALRRTDSSICWLPDLIEAKARGPVLIDCKGGMTSQRTGRSEGACRAAPASPPEGRQGVVKREAARSAKWATSAGELVERGAADGAALVVRADR